MLDKPSRRPDEPAMLFFDYARAPSPRRARILLAEKGIPHETRLVDLAAAEQRTAAYRAINPACTVPALSFHCNRSAV